MDQKEFRTPAQELRARDYRAMARNALRSFWTLAVIVTLVAALLGGVTSSTVPSVDLDVNVNVNEMQQLPDAPGNPIVEFAAAMEQYVELHPWIKAVAAFASILAAIQFVVGGPVMLGYSRFKLHLLDGEEAKFADLFSCFGQFIEGLWMRVRIFLQVLGWSLLFIVPGIVAAYRYAMIPYLMADHPDMSVSSAFAASKQLMTGRKWKLFCLHLSYIGWWLVCALTLGIASLWIMPYSEMAETAFYRNISGEIR